MTVVRILLVEDSSDDAELLVLALSRGGFEPHAERVANAAALHDALTRERWDLVLTDYSVPGFGDGAAIDVVKAFDPDLPLIVVSGVVGEEVAVEMMRRGARDFVLKSAMNRLAPAVEREIGAASSRRCQRAAERAAAHLAALVESTGDAIISKSIDGIITSWNPAAENFYGWSASEAIGRPISILVPSDKSDELAEVMTRLHRGEPVGSFETVRVHRDGSRIDVALTISPVWDATGQLVGVSKIARDIRRRKQSEAALHASEQRFRKLFESGLFGTCIWNGTGQVLEANDTFLELIGFTREDLEAGRLSWLDMTPPEYRSFDAAAQLELSSNGRITPYEKECIRKDGTRVPVLVGGVPSDRGAVAFAIDLSARRKAEESLLRSEGRYRLLVEATAAIVWDSPPNGAFDTAQPGWTAFTGQTVAQHRGWGWLDVVHPDDRAASRHAWNRACVTRGTYQVEHRLRRADGEYRHMSVRAVPIRDVHGAIREWVGIHTDITETKRAVETSARLAAIVSDSLDAIISEDLEGRITSWNRAAERLFGWTAEEVIGRDTASILPHQGADYDDPVRSATDAESVEVRAATRRHRDGRELSIALTRSPIHGTTGQTVGHSNILRDVSQQRRAEEALRTSEERLRAVIASMAEGVIIADARGRLLLWNDAALRLHGYSDPTQTLQPLEAFASTYEFFYPDGTRVELSDWPMARVLRGERLSNYELRVRRRDLSLDLVIGYGGAPVLDAEGKVALAALTLHDMTEYRRAQAERDRWLGRLQLQIERMPLGYISLDDDERVVGWNAAAERIFGYSRAEALGMQPPFEKLVPAELWPELEPIRERAQRGDVSAHSINRNVTKDGRSITCEWINIPLPDAKGRTSGMMCLVQDITEKLSFEERIRQSQKMEAVGKLAGGVAHDFNNLLTIINGYSDLLLTEELSPNDTARELVSEIRRAGERSAGLTHQLLAFSRQQVVSPRVLDLNVVVAASQTLLGRVIGEDVRLETSLAHDLWSVRADPGQVDQVLMNLAVNARDAMPTGGRLMIETRNVELTDEFARTYPDVKPGAYVLLAVSDTGFGMTAAVKARIFEPFFTTKMPGRGTGLGLATVFGIVQQAGGLIDVYSEVDVGTTFKIYLPRTQAGAGRASREAVTAMPRGSETVLVVEDEDVLRALAMRVLRKCGYFVLEARDGDEALQVSEAHAGPLHLLITDVVLPSGGGRKVAEALASLRPGLRVLYVSGYTDDAIMRHGILHETVNFLQKPFSPMSLAIKVRDVLDQAERAEAL